MAGTRGRIAWLIPSLIEGSGGHRTMFQNIAALIARGYECHAFLEEDHSYMPGGRRDAAELRRQVTRLFGPTEAVLHAGHEIREPFDLILATAWHTARIVRNLPLPSRKAYFVQDYEAWFYPMGDGYLMAEDSYRLGLAPITIGRWLAYRIRQEFQTACRYFDFCADRSVYRVKADAPREKAVCFVCQPEKPRRCTRLGLEALGILKHFMPDVQVYLYGSREPAHAWFAHSNLGLLPVSQCNDLYNRCRVGLCISSSNPSRIPFEMMAAGLPVVDVHRENNLYDMPEDAVLLADPTPESIAKALALIVQDDARRSSMSRQGITFMAGRDLSDGYAQFVEAVEHVLADRPPIPGEIPRLYRRPSVHADTAMDIATLGTPPDEPPPTGEQTSYRYLMAAQARAELDQILHSRAWRMLNRVKHNPIYRWTARLRFGPGWDRHDAAEDPAVRLARVKASRSYRLILAAKQTPLYRWYLRRRHTADLRRSCEAATDSDAAGDDGPKPPNPGPGTAPLITLDVWDTVLRRRCHPDEVKLFTARCLYLNHHRFLRSEYGSPWKLMLARLHGEAEIGRREQARGNDDEYAIEEVLTEWIGSVLTSEYPADRVPALAAKLADLETRQEIAVAYVDGRIRPLLSRTARTQRLFLSDFYMGADRLAMILHHYVPPVTAAECFVSCDHRVNKRSGRLFTLVEAQRSVSASRHTHVGDNRLTDVAVPAALGIRAILHRNGREERKRARYARRFRQRPESLRPYVHSLRRTVRKACHAPPDRSGPARTMFNLGSEYSLLFCGYVLRAIERAIQLGVERVYYFTREGAFLRAIHDAIRSASPLGVDIPPSEILEVSRIATFLPSLREVSANELMRLWNLYSTQSMQALFRTLAIEAEPFTPFLHRNGLTWEEAVVHPWQDPRVLAFLGTESVASRIQESIEQRRRLLLRYLAARGFGMERRPTLIVDIGWRGTIQDNLALILPDTTIHGCYLGLQPLLNEQPPNVVKFSFGPDANTDGPSAALPIRYVPALEMLTNSPEGSVVGYEEHGDRVVAVKMAEASEDRVYHEYCRHFQDGVLAGVAPFCDWVRRHAVTSVEFRPEACAMLGRLMQNPPRILTKAFFSLSHNEWFGLGRYDDKAAQFPFAMALQALVSRAKAREFSRFIQSTGWPQGFLTYHHLHPVRVFFNRRLRRKAARGML
mgnify:CR=1 FL=1